MRITGDGSHTLYVPELNEHFHSMYGAIEESRHVFIKEGFLWLKERHDGKIKVMEAGFGMGLNALLVYIHAQGQDMEVEYHGYDLFPLDIKVSYLINYAERMGHPELREIFLGMHSSTWGEGHQLSDNFRFHKHKADWRDVPLGSNYSLVFYDAFAPRVQPGMWGYEVMEKIAIATAPGGVFVTYTSKGDVRRNLSRAGFDVERIPGPPGKRHMLRGVRIS